MPLQKVEVREAGTITPERGFSSFKFLPGTRDTVIIALKSEEKSVTDSQVCLALLLLYYCFCTITEASIDTVQH
jgi:Apyrase